MFTSSHLLQTTGKKRKEKLRVCGHYCSLVCLAGVLSRPFRKYFRRKHPATQIFLIRGSNKILKKEISLFRSILSEAREKGRNKRTTLYLFLCVHLYDSCESEKLSFSLK